MIMRVKQRVMEWRWFRVAYFISQTEKLYVIIKCRLLMSMMPEQIAFDKLFYYFTLITQYCNCN